MKTIIVSIDYEEFQPETYRGVEVRVQGEEPVRFESGDFEKDWNDAADYCQETDGLVMVSSSVDHFFQDGAPYEFSRN